MEVLDDVGVADAIARRSMPPEQMAATAFYAGFAGPGPEYGRRLARLECWSAGVLGAGDGEPRAALAAALSQILARPVVLGRPPWRPVPR